MRWKKPALTKKVPGNIKNTLYMSYPAFYSYMPLTTHVTKVMTSMIASHLKEGTRNMHIITRNHDILWMMISTFSGMVSSFLIAIVS